jgi:hypothetical protein
LDARSGRLGDARLGIRVGSRREVRKEALGFLRHQLEDPRFPIELEGRSTFERFERHQDASRLPRVALERHRNQEEEREPALNLPLEPHRQSPLGRRPVAEPPQHARNSLELLEG